MPKGQQRSNRAPKKPKQPKRPAVPATPFRASEGKANPFGPVKKT